MTALQQQTAAIGLETSLVGASNAERERQMLVMETLNQLQAQGITVTDGLRAQVEAEANARYNQVAAYDAATEAAYRLQFQQEELAAVNDEIGYAFEGSIKGLISDLVQGKSATEALFNAVSRLADRLLDIALDQMFAGIFTGGAKGGGMLGSLFSELLGFGRGGYTGPGGKYQPAGVVQKGEYVFDKAATNRIGVANLEALRKGSFAKGGYTLPRISKAAPASAAAVAAAPRVDARTQIVNTFDAQSFLNQALSSQEGVKTILNAVRAQPGAFKAALNG